MLFRDRPRGLAVPAVIPPDLLDAFNRFIDRREGEQPFTARVAIGPAGVLREDGLAAGEVADAAVAEPSAAGLDVHVLSDAELAMRLLNVSAVSDRIGG